MNGIAPKAHSAHIEPLAHGREPECALDSFACRIFFAEPASTSAENALGAPPQAADGQVTRPETDGEPTLRNKVVVMTGATSGIGQVAAERLAGLGARLVLVA